MLQLKILPSLKWFLDTCHKYKNDNNFKVIYLTYYFRLYWFLISGDRVPVSWRGCYCCVAILHWWRCKNLDFLFDTFRIFIHKTLFLKTFAVSMCFLNQKDESFYTVTWACSTDGTPLLVAGGINGIIRVIDAGNEKIHKVLDTRYLWSTFHCIYVSTCSSVLAIMLCVKEKFWTEGTWLSLFLAVNI